jgi:hypothetical protein
LQTIKEKYEESLKESKDQYATIEKKLLDQEKELIKRSEAELEKENQALNLSQNIEKKLIETENKLIQSEFENQRLSNRLQELQDTMDSIEKDKVNTF